jgi:hypothetical protein
MIARSDRKIGISRNETLTVNATNAQLIRLGTEGAPSQELRIVATHNRQTIRIQARANGIAALKVSSSTGERWETALFPGTNLIDFIIEPSPEEWHCENDTGDPPHPVSKGDKHCKLCGGIVIHGSK